MTLITVCPQAKLPFNPPLNSTAFNARGGRCSARGLRRLGTRTSNRHRTPAARAVAPGRAGLLLYMVLHMALVSSPRQHGAHTPTKNCHVRTWGACVRVQGPARLSRTSFPNQLSRRPYACHCMRMRSTRPGDFDKTDAPVQLRNRCGSTMRGLGCGSRIERGGFPSTHITPPRPRPVS